MAGVTSNYAYDALYQLTQVTQAANTTESYTYDPVGNRLSSLTAATSSYNSANEMTSNSNATYTYDNNGNTTSKTDSTGTTSYTWDFENRLANVTVPGAGGTVSYKYDPSGRRIYKSSTSGTSTYSYDGDNLIEEANSSGAVVASYTQTENVDEPLAMLRSGTTNYYHVDGLGSVTSLSNGAGALAQTYTFDSFGNQTASSGALANPFQYTARESDGETKLHFYRAREYDPTAGRFITEDPASFAAGVNHFAYVDNSPLNFNDPTGYDKCLCGKQDCIPRSALLIQVRLQLALMKYASKKTGVTYFVGLQGSYARTKFGFGFSVGGSVGLATDPQGNEAFIESVNGAGTIGTPGISGGFQIGAATYADVSGFCGNSYGGEGGVGNGLVVGGGYSTNSSGLFTYANVGGGFGKNINVSPNAISRGVKVKLICK